MSSGINRIQSVDIYRSSSLRVVSELANLDDLFAVVTFSPRSDAATLDQEGYASRFLHNRRVNAFHVIPRENHWYQHSELPDALACIRSYLGRQAEIVTYGSSMGGYAAMRFAEWIGAKRAVVISPQFSPNSSLIQTDPRWDEYLQGVECLWEKDRCRSNLKVTAFFDPLNSLDSLHIKRCGEYFDLTGVPVRRAGHPAGEMLSEMGFLQNHILEIMRGSREGWEFTEEIRTGYKKTACYLMSLSYALRPHHANIKLELAKAAVDIKPDGWHLSYLASVLVAQGALEPARSAIDTAILSEPDASRYKVWRAMLLESAADQEKVYKNFDPAFVRRECSAFQDMIDRSRS